MSSVRSSTCRAIEALLKNIPNKQANLNDPLLISASTTSAEAISRVEAMKKGQSLKLAKDVSREVATVVAKNLQDECQLILDSEMSEQVVVAVAENMQPFTRLVFPADISQGIAIKGVTALPMACEILLCQGMPQNVAIAIIKSLPENRFIAIDARMSQNHVKTLIENLPVGRAINLDLHLPPALIAIIRQFKPEGCWINELMISDEDSTKSIPISTLIEIEDSVQSVSLDHVEDRSSPSRKMV